MRPPFTCSPAEKRLVALLLILTALGGIPRCAARWSPAFDLWLRSDPFPAENGVEDRAPGAAPPASGAGRAPAGIDPNRADEAALRSLPGVGPVLAGRIVAARREAPFRSPEDLLRVSGIGPATLAKLRPHLVWPASRDSS